MYQGDSDILSWLNAARCHETIIYKGSFITQSKCHKVYISIKRNFLSPKNYKYFYTTIVNNKYTYFTSHFYLHSFKKAVQNFL